MPSTIGTPMSARPCLLASVLFLSVFGRPVAGSFGSFSHTKLPQSAPPQLVTRTWLSLSPVYQVPVGSAANADAIKFAITIKPASPSATAALRWVLIATSGVRWRNAEHSETRADCLGVQSRDAHAGPFHPTVGPGMPLKLPKQSCSIRFGGAEEYSREGC